MAYCRVTFLQVKETIRARDEKEFTNYKITASCLLAYERDNNRVLGKKSAELEGRLTTAADIIREVENNQAALKSQLAIKVSTDLFCLEVMQIKFFVLGISIDWTRGLVVCDVSQQKPCPFSSVDGCHWPQQWPGIPLPAVKTQLALRNNNSTHNMTCEGCHITVEGRLVDAAAELMSMSMKRPMLGQLHSSGNDQKRFGVLYQV